MRTLRIAAAYCSVTCLAAATRSSTTRGDQCPVGRHPASVQHAGRERRTAVPAAASRRVETSTSIT